MADEREGRIPPQAIEAEQSVLGALLISHFVLDDVAEILNPGDFYRFQHQTIYEVILELNAANDAVDLVTVAQSLRNKAVLDQAGGYAYLMDLAASIPTAVNAVYYARIVKKKAVQRQVIRTGLKAIELGHDDEAEDHIDLASSLMLELCTNEGGEEVSTIADAADEVMAQIRAARVAYETYHGARIPNRILTGIYDLDRRTLGAGKGQVIVIAGRPAMGKSSLLFQVGKNIAAGDGTGEPLPVVAFSLEMDRDELIKRFASSESGVDGELITLGYMSDEQEERLYNEIHRLSKLPFVIDASPNLTVNRIRTVCRRQMVKHGGKLGAVLIDYIQLMGSINEDSGGSTGAARQIEIAKISRGLKNLASELRCPIFVAAQLNRNVESRTDKRPQLSDLRDSGAIEQDAHQVWLLYRDEYYNADSAYKGVAEVIVAKNRGGKTGTVKLGFNAAATTFYCLDFMARRAEVEANAHAPAPPVTQPALLSTVKAETLDEPPPEAADRPSDFLPADESAPAFTPVYREIDPDED